MVYITGDTHGEQGRFVNAAQQPLCTAGDTLIICGDFGYLFDNDARENAFLDVLEQCAYTICFVDGNHENFPAIFSYPEEQWQGGRVHRIRKNVLHLMRGQVFTIEEMRFFTMGGAYSIDRFLRSVNQSYWEEELPTGQEYQEAVQNLARHENRVDYILTHTCPREIIRWLGHAPDAHDLELTGFLEYLMYEIEYTHWYFGHWHLDQEITPKITALWFDTIALPQRGAESRKEKVVIDTPSDALEYE